jgi:hypothetical protein
MSIHTTTHFNFDLNSIRNTHDNVQPQALLPPPSLRRASLSLSADNHSRLYHNRGHPHLLPRRMSRDAAVSYEGKFYCRPYLIVLMQPATWHQISI